MQNLEEVYKTYLENRAGVKLIVDEGSENKGATDTFIQTTAIQKLLAQTDIPFSNSMIEAINKKMKYEYWLEPQDYDLETFERLTERSVADYNHRPHGMLKGLTPFEALNASAQLDYALKIDLASQKRKTYNLNEFCGLCITEKQ